jgi:DNA-binding response OmpR family regulator
MQRLRSWVKRLNTMATRLLLDDDKMAHLRVLVADPIQQMRKIIHNILTHNMGVEEVVEVNNGEKALEALQDRPCDVLILDAAMRPLGGIELARRIRHNEEKVDPFIPIIIVSDTPVLGEVMGARDAGVTEYLAKPLSAKILELHMRALMKHPRPFVKAESFIGPDRRHRIEDLKLDKERRTHPPEIIVRE